MLMLRAVCVALCLAGFLLPCWGQEDADKVSVMTTPARTLEQIEAIYARMPPLTYKPPKDRWKRLPRTAELLKKRGGPLRILALGDSIINDTCRSSWDHLMRRSYPGREITLITCVRGSTGCWWYKTPERLLKYVYPQKPDLLILGGISHQEDIDSIRELVQAVQAKCGCDVLLITPVFGLTDPKDDKQWQAKLDTKGTDFRAKLYRLSEELKVGFLDMTAPWGEYIRASGRETIAFKRDTHHANEEGEQIAGRILAIFLGPSK